jgi:hypothetical protein
VAEVDGLPPLLLDLLVDLAVVDGLLLVRRGRRQEHEQVVALLRGDLGRGAGVDLADRDVVDGDAGVVLLAPLLAEHAVEPLVVARDEVAPLDDLERLPLRAGAAGSDARPRRRGERAEAGDLHEFPAGEPSLSLRHGDTSGAPARRDW